jgi:hypothetical protein
VLDRAQGRLDPGSVRCLEDGVEHDWLDAPAADRRPPTDWRRLVLCSWLPRRRA